MKIKNTKPRGYDVRDPECVNEMDKVDARRWAGQIELRGEKKSRREGKWVKGSGSKRWNYPVELTGSDHGKNKMRWGE